MKPVIGVTMGDPTGIGPEILLKALSNRFFVNKFSFVVFGDRSYLEKVFRYFKNKGLRLRFPSSLPFVDPGLMRDKPAVFGRIEQWAGYASGVYIQAAVQSILKKEIDAIVTLPINKEAFASSSWGKKYVDHTGMLASLTKTKEVALMLVSGNLRAVHVTQHVPLKKVPSLVTRSRVSVTISLTWKALKRMGIRRPRIAVCGLNPHAGDGGVLGREEIDVIQPVIQALRKKGVPVTGPLSADAVWPLVKNRTYDAAVAMYHDQGQIPVKLNGLDVVNVTLGLPFVRTSVGHGTGFDIAGKGKASEESFMAAVQMAATMVR